MAKGKRSRGDDGWKIVLGGTNKYHRCSIRLKGYDYTQPGAYFLTIVTQNRECILGNISDYHVLLNDAGLMVQKTWHEIPEHYMNIAADSFIVMPDHIHGIIVFSMQVVQARGQDMQARGPATTTTRLSLPDIVHRFKSLTTKRYIDGVKSHNWRICPGRLWQRNYYEHIIRDEQSLENIRRYIQCNPVSGI